MASIAVIGTGISGLGAALLLHKHHEITVYEKSDTIGGHTRTRTIDIHGQPVPVDTGFIVFNYRNYPLLSALFSHLGVPVQKSTMTFGVSINNGALEWGAQNPNALFGQRRNLLRPAFYRLLLDVVRFNHLASTVAERHPDLSVGELLKKIGVGKWFAPYYLLPMGGAIWSCGLPAILQFPALSFIRFFKAHGLLTITQQPQWYTVTGGSQEYVKRLVAPFKDRILTGCGVTLVTRHGGKVQVTDSQGTVREYDQVVFACHADQVSGMLGDPTEQEKSVLGAFTYQKNFAVLHKDESVMPRRRRCWSSWVYTAEDKQKNDTICVTYWMNLLQSLKTPCPIFVTLNPLKPIGREHVFDEHWFEHPVYSRAAVDAQAQIPMIQGKQNSWFCGAYQRNGFHEDGLASAVAVASALGGEVPWA